MQEQQILKQYAYGPMNFSGSEQGFYERHLKFDHIVPLQSVNARDKFEAAAFAVRDLLSQRWVKTEQTYQENNVKRIYYMSLEFLIGRSLANNVGNLMIDPVFDELC